MGKERIGESSDQEVDLTSIEGEEKERISGSKDFT